jgi:phage anti-repressor protein
MANRSRSPEERDMLMNMAQTWDVLAENRKSHLARQERISALDGTPASIPVDRLNASNDD